MLLRIAALMAFAFCCSAQAAEIKAFPLDKPGQGAIVVNGDIQFKDGEEFLIKISSFSGGIVVFNSRGGSAFAGIEIGKAIRMRNFTTWVPSGSACASACAIAWLGGTRRLMGKAALIGFHSVYTIEGGAPVENGAGNAIYGAYLSQLGLSDRAIMYLSVAAPTSMNWLTPAEAESYGISLTVFDPKPAQSMPTPATNPAINLEARSRDFVIALNVIISGPTEQYLKAIGGFYSDQVLYFGRQLSRAEVVDQLTKFIARWPVRSYVVQPDSMKVQCNVNSSECHIDGLVNFDAKSTERKKWSHGVATFDYLLSFHPGARWPMIVTEGGSVVNRRLEAFESGSPPYARELGAGQ